MYTGQLTKWNEVRGFGFIKTAELDQDTFLHVTQFKHMSRKPREGDVIHFDIEQVNGKKRATNARIEGVKAIPRPKMVKGSPPRAKFGFLFVALTIIIVAVTIQRLDLVPIKTAPVATPFSTHFDDEPVFTCDGRQYCSQMTSRAESLYFIEHCPDTKMDGDDDGIPCENDSRF